MNPKKAVGEEKEETENKQKYYIKGHFTFKLFFFCNVGTTGSFQSGSFFLFSSATMEGRLFISEMMDTRILKVSQT